MLQCWLHFYFWNLNNKSFKIGTEYFAASKLWEDNYGPNLPTGPHFNKKVKYPLPRNKICRMQKNLLCRMAFWIKTAPSCREFSHFSIKLDENTNTWYLQPLAYWTLSIKHYLKVQKLYTTRKTVLLPPSSNMVETTIAELIPQSLKLHAQVTLRSLGWRHKTGQCANSHAHTRRSVCFCNQGGEGASILLLTY
jgi:hypothetical protein